LAGTSPRVSPVADRLLPVASRLSLIVLVLLAAFLRLCWLDEVPPGFTHDEAGHGHDAIAILHGARPIYETVGYGREPLYDYWVAGLMALGGAGGNVLRFASVPLGLATLLLTFAWTRRAFGDTTALLAVAFQAASFWSLATSRQALRSSLLPVLFTAAACLCWRWVEPPPAGAQARPRWGLAAPFALLVGATLYTYIPARILWAVFALFLAYLVLFHRRLARRMDLPVLVGLLGGLLLAAPLFAYLRAHPGAEQRLAMLDEPLRALWAGDASVILQRAWSGIAAFFIPGHGDDFLAYNIPGRPFFDPLTGALFVAGLGLCIARWRRPACAMALLWFLVGVAPTLVTGAAASTTRSIAALPVAFLFPALAVAEGMRRAGQRLAPAIALAAAALILVSGGLAARDYFVVWGQSPDVRAAYQHTLVEMAGYLDAHSVGGTVALSTVYPQAPHDPYVFEMSLRRRDLATRWCDARRALLIPATGQARLLTPSSAPLDPAFALAGLRREEQVAMRPGDLDPFFLVYAWEPPRTLAALQERAAGAPLELALPVDLGGALRFLGYELRTPDVTAGGQVELLTLWQVTDPARLRLPERADALPELVLFTHALDASGAVVGQEDRLDAPAWCWASGDVVAQIHRFALPADLSPGPVALEVGVYHRATLRRLPVLVDGAVVGDVVRLPPLEVSAP
jgi:4-amino-4-deoxy-L-arabinose transferase-like glycosyltransferase